VTLEEMREIALSFPGCTEGRSYGAPAFLVNKKFFTRLRRDDASLVLMEVSFDEREMLIEAEPQTFHFTAHYKDYPAVLAHGEPASRLFPQLPRTPLAQDRAEEGGEGAGRSSDVAFGAERAAGDLQYNRRGRGGDAECAENLCVLCANSATSAVILCCACGAQGASPS
jgi:hypothetical protein